MPYLEIPNPRPGDMRFNPQADVLPVAYKAPRPSRMWPGSYGPRPRNQADVYLPDVQKADAPLIIYLHSGGWAAGSRVNIPELIMRQVTRASAVLVSADYTLSTPDTPSYPQAPYDIDRLVRWCRLQAPNWGVTGRRIILAGGSAGGHLAALAACAPGQFSDKDLHPHIAAQDPVVQGLICLAAPTELQSVEQGVPMGTHLVRQFLGCKGPCPGMVLGGASPINWSRRLAPPPAYLAYGLQDLLVPPGPNGKEFAQVMADKRGDACGIWYDLVDSSGHNLDHSTINLRSLECWIDLVAKGK
jgi:acetyl esterase/lipase